MFFFSLSPTESWEPDINCWRLDPLWTLARAVDFVTFKPTTDSFVTLVSAFIAVNARGKVVPRPRNIGYASLAWIWIESSLWIDESVHTLSLALVSRIEDGESNTDKC